MRLLLHSANSHDRVKAHQIHTLALRNAKRSKQLFGGAMKLLPCKQHLWHSGVNFCTVLQATPVTFKSICTWIKTCNCIPRYLLRMGHCIQHGLCESARSIKIQIQYENRISFDLAEESNNYSENADRIETWKSMLEFLASPTIFNLQEPWLNHFYINRKWKFSTISIIIATLVRIIAIGFAMSTRCNVDTCQNYYQFVQLHSQIIDAGCYVCLCTNCLIQRLLGSCTTYRIKIKGLEHYSSLLCHTVIAIARRCCLYTTAVDIIVIIIIFITNCESCWRQRRTQLTGFIVWRKR